MMRIKLMPLKVISERPLTSFYDIFAEKAKNLPPMNTEYTEICRKELYSATLGDFGEVRRIISLFGCNS
jgi:hypothetical protein